MDNLNPETMPLEQFINLPTTIDFHTIYSARFRNYIKDKPYIRVGTQLAGDYVVAYIPQDKIGEVVKDIGHEQINVIPNLLGLLGKEDLSESGISKVTQMPQFNLKGKGVVIGFIDTGIDYTKDAFRYEDGTSKILRIWDQTLEGTPPEQSRFGAVYTQEQINQALAAENPFETVPTKDTVGHGTFLASVACGRENNEYIGAAPDAEIIAVKLRKARQYYLDMYQIPKDQENVYESTDVMLGLKYILDMVGIMKEPAAVVICIGIGSNFGNHDGTTAIEEYISHMSKRPGIVFCTAAGNESSAKHHIEGVIEETGDTRTIDISVDNNVEGFSVAIHNSIWDRIPISIKSPIGELISRISVDSNDEVRKELTLEDSTVIVGYYKTTANIAFIRIHKPTPGIWQIMLHGDSVIDGRFHAWLPVTGLVSPGVSFVTPSPNYTVVIPATSIASVTCGAYNGKDNSLYSSSSWGPTTNPRIAPDFVAPGVEVSGVYPYGYGTMTGTSAAAAITSGASALVLQWGVLEKGIRSMNASIVRSILVRGCKRDTNQIYPNDRWGYGKLDLTGSFNLLREE